MSFTTAHGEPKPNGHDSGIIAELEQQPAVVPERLAQMPAWLRAPLIKARGAFLMVEKKAAGTFSVREGIVYVVLAASLTFGAASYWKGQEQRDELIRIRTTLDMFIKDRAQLDAQQDSRIDQAMNYGQSAKGDAQYIKGKFDQFAQQVTVERAVKQ